VKTGLNQQEGSGSASKDFPLNFMHPVLLSIFYDMICGFFGVYSYSESEYFKQTMRQGGPSKPKEPRIPRMPQL
jgi:hypothetical protein